MLLLTELAVAVMVTLVMADGCTVLMKNPPAALPDGITVHVGSDRESQAQYRLSGVAQVREFLHKLRTEFA